MAANLQIHVHKGTDDSPRLRLTCAVNKDRALRILFEKKKKIEHESTFSRMHYLLYNVVEIRLVEK